MAKTTRHVLENSLEDLDEKQMKKFIGRLVDPEREEPRVKRSAVEDPTDRVCVVNAIVGTYTEAGAGGVVVEILRGMNYNEDAKRLEKKLEELKQEARPPASPELKQEARPPASPELKQEASTGESFGHFVDKHRNVLIQRIKRISGNPGILEKLREDEVLSDDDYKIIMNQQSPQQQAKKLCDWALKSSENKDSFYRVLEEFEPLLIVDLKSS